MEDGAAGKQADRGQPGGPVPAPQTAGQQQQRHSGGGHGHGGPPRQRAGDQVLQQPQPIPLGGEQSRDQVDKAGENGQGGRQAWHP